MAKPLHIVMALLASMVALSIFGFVSRPRDELAGIGIRRFSDDVTYWVFQDTMGRQHFTRCRTLDFDLPLGDLVNLSKGIPNSEIVYAGNLEFFTVNTDLTWNQVLWIRLTHPGSDPFQSA